MEATMYYFQEYLKKEKPAYMPVIRLTESINLCPEFFRDELRAALKIISDDGFISEKTVPALEAFVLNPLLDKLRSYCRMDQDGAKMIAEEMADMLRTLRSDDQSFPAAQIGLITDRIGEALSE
jgi:hypothetical protein